MMIWVGDRDFGSIVPEAEALVSVRDLGFTVGAGVFETMKVVDGVPFALTRHLRRLDASAAILGLPPCDERVLRGAVAEVLQANDSVLEPFARLRITYTAGARPLADGTLLPTLVVSVTNASPWPETTRAITVPWVCNERSAVTGAKSTSYAEYALALRAAQAAGASEAIMANSRGELCEGGASNVFVVVDGQVLTPSLASGCLPGITRQLLIERFGAVEQRLPMSILATADEVFVTSSTRDVHPVVRLDDREWVGPGDVAIELRHRFAAMCASDMDP